MPILLSDDALVLTKVARKVTGKLDFSVTAKSSWVRKCTHVVVDYHISLCIIPTIPNQHVLQTSDIYIPTVLIYTNSGSGKTRHGKTMLYYLKYSRVLVPLMRMRRRICKHFSPLVGHLCCLCREELTENVFLMSVSCISIERYQANNNGSVAYLQLHLGRSFVYK